MHGVLAAYDDATSMPSLQATDRGLGLRCHPQIAWAKLKTLSEGARLASGKLW